MWSHKKLFGLPFLAKKNCSTGGTGVQQEIESYYCIFTSASCISLGFTLTIAFVSHFLTALLGYSSPTFSFHRMAFLCWCAVMKLHTIARSLHIGLRVIPRLHDTTGCQTRWLVWQPAEQTLGKSFEYLYFYAWVITSHFTADVFVTC